MAKPSVCPRCDAGQIEKIADSMIPGRWEVYRCAKCNYVWRDTENLQGITKLTKEMIDEAKPAFY